MTPWNIIFALSSTTSRNDHTQILESIDRDNDFWRGANLCLTPYVTFGVKELPRIDEFGVGQSVRAFYDLTDALANRTLTGHAALDAIKEFGSKCTEEQWFNWYKRILEKDLSCGVGVKTFNKSSPEKYKVNAFECQLAKPISSVKTENLPTDACIETKYDGTRVLFFVFKNKEVVAYSRNGLVYNNFGPIEDQLAVLVNYPGFPEEGLVIDGEVISSDFNALMTQVRRKNNVRFNGTLLAFDVIPINVFKNKGPTPPLRERREMVKNLIGYVQQTIGDSLTTNFSVGVDNVNVRDDLDYVMTIFSEQVEAGFEGIIIKDLNSEYQYGKTADWLKLKPTETYDMTVIGVIEGEGRLVGALGALICECVVDGKIIRSRVGSGIPDDQRKLAWKENLIGRIVEIEADSISSNKNGSYSLRFARFKRWRDDKL